tara:strand:- start:2143 stop:4752 length:2610 start_codon:yes stop_codon:yes gene_type:complete
LSRFNRFHTRLVDLLIAGTSLSVRRPLLTILTAFALAAVSVWFTVSHVRINTSNTDMLSAELSFRRDAIAFSNAFPALSENLVIVVDAATPDAAEDAARQLTAGLAAKADLYEWVFYEKADPFLRRQGLLYLTTPELEKVADDLAATQPLLARLHASPNLAGLASVVDLAVTQGDSAARESLGPSLDRLSAVFESVAAGNPTPLSWISLLGGDDIPGSGREVVLARPRLDFGSLSPSGDAISGIRDAVTQLAFDPAMDVHVGITGSAALEQEELDSVRDGMGLVGLISLTLVLALLLLAYRTVRAVVATLTLLVCGLCITAGLATLVVGQFNLISVAFAVLFIGLGVDFALHYTLRSQEEATLTSDYGDALRGATRQTGAALLLCAISSAVAFFSFMPTEYRGVAELGLIAGMGMFVALTLSLTLLPALLMLSGTGKRPGPGRGMLVAPLAAFAIRRSGLVLVLAAVCVVASLMVIPQLRFDHDPMNLRDPSAQSVQLARQLMADPDRQTYAIDILVRDQTDLADLKAKLEQLETVAEVRTARSLYPDDQDEKLAIVQDLSFFLGPMAMQPAATSQLTDEARQQAADQLITLVSSAPEDFGAAGKRLVTAITRLSGKPEMLRRAEFLLLAGLDGRLQSIFDALRASAFTADDVPQRLTRFWISDTGQFRLEVVPHADMSDDGLRAAFVDEVVAIAPDATGTPVIIRAGGEAVVDAFIQAILYASVAVLVLLMVMLRNLLDVIIVAIPAMVGAIVTGGLMWMIGLSLNFANIIVLPLLFGLSVDFGIHMVMRAREERLEDICQISTMRAIVYSAATTVGSFAALSLSPHTGTASMGLLLTLSLAVTIIATLLITPALLQVTAGRRRGSNV